MLPLHERLCCATRRPSDSGQPDPQDWNTPQHIVQELSNEALSVPARQPLLRGKQRAGRSRGHGRVQSICNFVYQHIRFDYIQARANRTALEAFRERTGVCRNCSHLAITLCRCMIIPARYCTGYVAVSASPPSS